jgi:urease accessory protein UreE
MYFHETFESDVEKVKIELDKECEIMYRFGNRSSKIKGTIIAYNLENNYIRVEIKNNRVLIISLSHILEIK